MGEQRFAILIANSKFPEEPELEPLVFPVQEVDGLNDILCSDKHGQFTNTIVLKNEPSFKVKVEIESLLNKACKDDFVLIYYSGHGKLGNPLNHLHLTMSDTKIGLLGSTSIAMEDLKRMIDRCLSGKKLIILDCCYSGAAGKNFTKGSIDDQFKILSEGHGIYIMTASSSHQPAVDGVFTKHIINGIKTGEADEDEDGNITIDELYQYVCDKVRSESDQTPKKWWLNADGKLVIAKSGKLPRERRRLQIKKILCKLGMKDILSDKLLIEALAVNASIDGVERPKYFDLLSQLADRKIEVNVFSDKWNELTAKAEAKVAVVSPDTAEVATEIKTERATIEKPKYKLRQNPITVSDEEAQVIFGLTNRQQPIEYIDNNFVDNNNGTITDYATGLMWQQGGSIDKNRYIEAVAYIKELNTKKFSGYEDWRIPTIDELKSLLTRRAIKDNISAYYIDSLFDRTQSHCWTSDKRIPNGVRFINFSSGSVGWSDPSIDYYVRAVRSSANPMNQE